MAVARRGADAQGSGMSFLLGTNGRNHEQSRDAMPVGGAKPAGGAHDDAYLDPIKQRPALLDEKLKLHARIIDEFNLAILEKLPRDELIRQVNGYVANYVRTEKLSLNQKELELFCKEIIDEMTGYGPLEPLLKDPTVSDILINTHKRCFVERFGKLHETSVYFKDEAHLLRIIGKIVAGVGRRIDESSPMVDARLPDGSRVNVAVRPISIDGPLVSIRKFSERAFGLPRLVEVGTLNAAMADVLMAAVRGRISLIISGGTGSGKTTLLNALSGFIPHQERLITIEELRGIAIAATACRPPRDAAAERRGQRRDQAARTGEERAAHAAGPDHRWRVSRRGSVRHVAGHEYRPRRVDDHDPCQFAARCAAASRADGHYGRHIDQSCQYPRPNRLGGHHGGAIAAITRRKSQIDQYR